MVLLVVDVKVRGVGRGRGIPGTALMSGSILQPEERCLSLCCWTARQTDILCLGAQAGQLSTASTSPSPLGGFRAAQQCGRPVGPSLRGAKPAPPTPWGLRSWPPTDATVLLASS